ncbi:MAG: hypothetical protein Q4E57_08355 [Eubacteriales bacterium]|nr:hypothetical protein [Eubacteriales bacterium]
MAWLIFAAVIYAANALFMRRTRTLNQVAALNIVLGIPEFIVLYRLFMPVSGVWAHMFLVTAVLFAHIRIANRLFEPVTIDSSIRFFEMGAAGFMLASVYAHAFSYTGNAVGWLFAALASAFAGLIAGRLEGAANVSRGSGFKGLSVVAGIIAVITAGAAVFMAFFSDATGNIIERIIGGVVSLVKMAGAAVLRLLDFLMSLIPADNMDYVDPREPVAGIPMGNMEAVEYSDKIMEAAGAAAVVLLAAAVIVILFKLRGMKMVKIEAKEGRRSKISDGKPGIWDMLRAAFSRLGGKVHREIRYRQIRNTVPGVMITLERALRHTPYEKRAGESYGSFARRLADVIEEKGSVAMGTKSSESAALTCSLRQLAADFDALYYGGGEQTTLTAKDASGLVSQTKARLTSEA